MVKLVNSNQQNVSSNMHRIKYLLVFVSVFCAISVFGQKENKMVKRQKKQLEKQEVAKEKAQEKAIETRLKRHKKIQTKETQKRMKKTAKKNKQYHNKKKKFFLIRWFS